MKEICEGCLTHTDKEPKDCPVFSSMRENECPCIECLVKMMCREACTEMKDLWDSELLILAALPWSIGIVCLALALRKR